VKEPKTYTVIEAVQYSYDKSLTPAQRRVFYRRHIPNATPDELAGAFRLILSRLTNAPLRDALGRGPRKP
jgi:hypothetical protein